MYFAPHFSRRELTNTSTGLDNEPHGHSLSCLASLSHILENIRAVVNKPLYINSAFRSEAVNNAVGGVRTSFHIRGCAADISIRNLSADDLIKLESAIMSYKPAEFIKYDTFYHVAFDISRLGTRSGTIKTWQEEYPDSFPVAKIQSGSNLTDL